MVVITNQDEVHLHANKVDIMKIIGVLVAHLFVTLVLLSFIANFILGASLLAGTIATVLIASVMLTSAIWIALRWIWSRLTINKNEYQFVGSAYPLFVIVLSIAIMMVTAEAILGVGAVLLLSTPHVWWQLAGVVVLLVVMVLCLLFTIRYLKTWVHKNIASVK